MTLSARGRLASDDRFDHTTLAFPASGCNPLEQKLLSNYYPTSPLFGEKVTRVRFSQKNYTSTHTSIGMVEDRLSRGGDLNHVITMFAESSEPFPDHVDDAVTVEGLL